jgi:phytoene/squalene synthetase
MCLKVFVEGNEANYNKLKNSAMKLGSAFQKINFLRDFKADVNELGRMYFPELMHQPFNEETKKQIETDILKDFRAGYEGIIQLPKDARFGVYVAYIYYFQLFKKIKRLSATRIQEERIRIPDNQKYALFFGSYLRHSFNML